MTQVYQPGKIFLNALPILAIMQPLPSRIYETIGYQEDTAINIRHTIDRILLFSCFIGFVAIGFEAITSRQLCITRKLKPIELAVL
jgi:hypothetical protein